MNMERVECPTCQRLVSAYVPLGGDGSDVKIKAHKPHRYMRKWCAAGGRMYRELRDETPPRVPAPALYAATEHEPVTRVTLTELREAQQRQWKSLERTLILSALAQHDWHVGDAAAQLGVSRIELHRRMRQHGIKRGDFAP